MNTYHQPIEVPVQINMPPFTVVQSHMSEEDLLEYLLLNYAAFQQEVFPDQALQVYYAPSERGVDVFAQHGSQVTLFPALTNNGVGQFNSAIKNTVNFH